LDRQSRLSPPFLVASSLVSSVRPETGAAVEERARRTEVMEREATASIEMGIPRRAFISVVPETGTVGKLFVRRKFEKVSKTFMTFLYAVRGFKKALSSEGSYCTTPSTVANMLGREN
jgi:hypothetical protein